MNSARPASRRPVATYEPGRGGLAAMLEARSVAVVGASDSGSAFSAILHNDRGLACNLAVSSGLELTTDMAAYLDYAVGLPSTRVVALFVETARDPAALRAALARAAAREVPVVALKVGRDGRAGAMVAAHSGALAGEDGAWQALFDAYGVLRVRTMDELADTCELLLAGRRAVGGGLAVVLDSGGERAHLVDLADEAGVAFAEVGPATERRLAAVLDPGLDPVNPVDAWGTGHGADEVIGECLDALAADPATAAVAFCVDLTTEALPGDGYVRAAAEAALARAAGVPVLEGTATGLAALAHLLARRDHAAARAVPDPPPPAPADEVRARWRARLAAPGHLSELDGLALLADYGIPVTPALAAASPDEAVAAAERLGWPVALKTARLGLAHKSDAGGVRLGLAGPAQLAAAWAELAARLGPAMLVAAMAPPGVELALGVVCDPQFGPLVMVAAGGVLVELLRDRRFGLPPLGPRGRADARPAGGTTAAGRPARPPGG